MSSLASKAKSSVIWNTGFNLFRDILQFLVMIVLVRMISPESYGQFALVTSVIGFIHVFSFSTFIQHILQERDDSKVDYQNHFTFGFYLQVFMFIITNLIAFTMEYFNFYSTISTYMHVLSIVFFLELFSELRRMELQRNLDWKRMRILHGIGLIMGAVLALLMANFGAGIYALIIPGFMSNIPFIYEMFIIKKWRPTWEWNKIDYTDTINFSKKRILSGLMTTGKPLIENSLFVAILGYSQLGFYNRAIGLATLLVNKFALQLTLSLYPILTKIEPFTDAFRKVSGLIIIFVFWLIVPISFVVYNLSSELVYILYGEKWLDVIPFLAPASIILALSAINYVLYSLLLSSHKVKFCTYYDFFILFGTILFLIFILPSGVLNYLYSQIVLFSVSLFLLFLFNIYFKVLELASVFKALIPSFLATIFSGVLVNILLNIYSLDNNVVRLLSYSIFFSIGYMFFLRLFFKNDLIIIISYLPAKNIFYRFLNLNKYKDK